MSKEEIEFKSKLSTEMEIKKEVAWQLRRLADLLDNLSIRL